MRLSENDDRRLEFDLFHIEDILERPTEKAPLPPEIIGEDRTSQLLADLSRHEGEEWEYLECVAQGTNQPLERAHFYRLALFACPYENYDERHRLAKEAEKSFEAPEVKAEPEVQERLRYDVLEDLASTAYMRRDYLSLLDLFKQLEVLGVYPDAPMWLFYAMEIYAFDAQWEKADHIANRIFNDEVQFEHRFKLWAVMYAIRAFAAKDESHYHAVLEQVIEQAEGRNPNTALKRFAASLKDDELEDYFTRPLGWIKTELLKTYPDTVPMVYGREKRTFELELQDGNDFAEQDAEIIANEGVELVEPIEINGETLWIGRVVGATKKVQNQVDFLLVPAFRGIYARHDSWREYAVDDQGGLISLEEARGIPLDTPFRSITDLETQLPYMDVPRDRLFHGPVQTFDMIRADSSRPGFSETLLVRTKGDERKITGFAGMAYGWETTPEQMWEERIESYFAQYGLTQAEYLKKVETVCGLEAEQPTFYFAELGTLKPFRSNQAMFRMIRQTVEPGAQKGLDLLAFTSMQVNAFNFFRGSGSEIVYQPPGQPTVIMHGNTCQAIYDRFDNTPPGLVRDNREGFAQAKKEAAPFRPDKK